MKKQTIALALALTMVGTLAACSTEKNPGSSGANNGSTTGGATSGTNGSAGGTTSGSGSAGQVTRRYNTTMNQGQDYFYGNSYMDDGRYTAGSNGQVYSRDDNAVSRDLTRDARDIVRDAGDAIGDIGRGIGNAARDITGTNPGTPSWEPDSSAVRY